MQITADFSQAQSITYSRKNLRSFLFNLLSNAIKYAHGDRIPEIRIQTQYWPADELVSITVTDNGLGIPHNQKDKIFSMFRRVHTHVEGSGVGLYLVKKILENQGDWIEVESVEGLGSSFNVFFKQKKQPV